MGQKVNPNGIRLGVIKDHQSLWFAHGRDYAANLMADIELRKKFSVMLASAALSRVKIERLAKTAIITICTARPGVVIGKKGVDIDKLKNIAQRILGIPAHIKIEEIKKPDLDAKLVAQNIAQQLERRAMFRKVMKRAVKNTLQLGAQGIKVMVSGRLGGAEIARSESYREGRVPLHTLRADIGYAVCEANTTYGVIGVKVWIFKGEILGGAEQTHASKSEIVR